MHASWGWAALLFGAVLSTNAAGGDEKEGGTAAGIFTSAIWPVAAS